jgi:hypothetical protein
MAIFLISQNFSKCGMMSTRTELKQNRGEIQLATTSKRVFLSLTEYAEDPESICPAPN